MVMKRNKLIAETRYVRCSREPSDDLRTLCSVVAEKITTKPGERCLSDFEPALKSVPNNVPIAEDTKSFTKGAVKQSCDLHKYENYASIKRERRLSLATRRMPQRDNGLHYQLRFSIQSEESGQDSKGPPTLFGKTPGTTLNR
ncbi:hypothetical protein OSTOST_11538 [Ostertagia ostertagi]